MQTVNTLISRIRVLAGAAVTWLIAAQVALQWVLSQEILVEYPDWTQWLGQAVALIGGIVLVVRRVAPVDEKDQGLLP